MRFEARDLRSNIEPVKPADLVENQVYFAVSYVDDERLIPVLEPYIFQSRDPSGRNSTKLYFKSLDPVRRRVHRDQDDRLVELGIRLRVFEYEEALEELMLCSLRREGLLTFSNIDSSDDSKTAVHHVDARELKLFAEPLKPAELELGSIYFSLFFLDDAFLIPGLEPYVFIGSDIDPEDTGLYFQDIESYWRGARYGDATAGGPAILVVDSEETVNHFEYNEALEQLMVCSLRRQEAGVR
jgi:hypothetical protein